MKIVALKEFGYDDLISSSLAADTAAEWDKTTAFVPDDDVLVSYTQDSYPIDGTDDVRIAPIRKFRSLTDNTEEYPIDNTDNWLDLGATNRWGAFDNYVNSMSLAPAAATASVPSEFNFEINTSKCDHIGLFNLQAGYIEVDYKLTSKGVYEPYGPSYPSIDGLDYHPLPLPPKLSKTFKEHFFGPFLWSHDRLFQVPIGAKSSMKIRVVHDYEGKTAGLGYCTAGMGVSLGDTLYGAKASGRSFGRQTRDETTGYTFLKKGNKVKVNDLTVFVRRHQLPMVFSMLYNQMDTPLVFQGIPGVDFEPFLVFGFLTNFYTIVEGPDEVELNIEYEGLI